MFLLRHATLARRDTFLPAPRGQINTF
jgi:hypothetical protein